jgi:hypothetical protein
MLQSFDIFFTYESIDCSNVLAQWRTQRNRILHCCILMKSLTILFLVIWIHALKTRQSFFLLKKAICATLIDGRELFG